MEARNMKGLLIKGMDMSHEISGCFFDIIKCTLGKCKNNFSVHMSAFECLYQIIPFDKPAHYKHTQKWTLFLHF